MLDFATILDSQSSSARGLQLHSIGGIEYEEFLKAQDLGVIEPHLDYYGKFKWSSELVERKLAKLTESGRQFCPNLAAVLRQAKATGSGVIAVGD